MGHSFQHRTYHLESPPNIMDKNAKCHMHENDTTLELIHVLLLQYYHLPPLYRVRAGLDELRVARPRTPRISLGGSSFSADRVSLCSHRVAKTTPACKLRTRG